MALVACRPDYGISVGDVQRITTQERTRSERADRVERMRTAVTVDVFQKPAERCIDQKRGDACFALGSLLESGQAGLRANVAVAGDYYRTGCEAGSEHCCYNLGVFYRDGRGVPKSGTRARELLGSSCERGFGRACGVLGQMLVDGAEITLDAAQGIQLQERACELGASHACMVLGNWARDGNVMAQDLERAAALYRKACDGAVQRACARLGSLHGLGCTTGTGRTECAGDDHDVDELLPKLQVTCDGGDALSCAVLGAYYERGHGVSTDAERAHALFVRSCEGGDAFGCNNLANLYRRGQGVGQDLARAAELYTQACKSRFSLACTDLGALLLNTGASTDDARRFLALGCEYGSAPACDQQLALCAMDMLPICGEDEPSDEPPAPSGR